MYYNYVVVDLTFSLISHCLVTHNKYKRDTLMIDHMHNILNDDVMSLICPVPYMVLQLAAPLAT